MLRSLYELKGYDLAATDGHFGTVKDFYFDDLHWRVRYVVVDTGKWLPGRRVLISPLSVDNTDWTRRLISVSLSRKQIENSPSTDADKPVSRQEEQDFFDYYGWTPYWAPGGMVGPAPVAPIPGREPELHRQRVQFESVEELPLDHLAQQAHLPGTRPDGVVQDAADLADAEGDGLCD